MQPLKTSTRSIAIARGRLILTAKFRSHAICQAPAIPFGASLSCVIVIASDRGLRFALVVVDPFFASALGRNRTICRGTATITSLTVCTVVTDDLAFLVRLL